MKASRLTTSRTRRAMSASGRGTPRTPITAHVRPRLPSEQRLPSRRRTVMNEVAERGVVGQERHRLVDEVQNGDADRLSHPARRLGCGSPSQENENGHILSQPAPGAPLDPNVDGPAVETWRTRHGTHSDRSARHEGSAPALHPRLARGQPIYVAGQLPYDKDGNLVGKGDIKAQTRR